MGVVPKRLSLLALRKRGVQTKPVYLDGEGNESAALRI